MNGCSGRLASINRSPGGVPKQSVLDAWISTAGVDGDRQRVRVIHGGPDRAVVLFSLEAIRALQAEGHPIGPGSTGENLTVSGLDWPSLTIGARLSVGSVRLEITSYTEPCRQIARCFTRRDYRRIDQQQHPGWSRLCARVLSEGLVQVGDTVEVESLGPSGGAPSR